MPTKWAIYIYIYIFNLAIPHMDTSKSQATNTISYHGSYTYQKFTGSKKVILPCLTHIPANHRKKSYIVPCLRYQQITGNKAHLLCLSRKLANHRQQIVHLPIASHKCQQHTGNTSHILQCFFLQVPENHRPSCQQIVHLAMPHADTSKSRQQIVNLPCLRQIANQGKQIVHLTMPHTDGSKSQATNHTPHPGSHRHQQHTSNKSYTYHASHGASNTQATNDPSYNASHRFQQITGNRSCLTQTPAFIGNKSFHTDNKQQITGNKLSFLHAPHRYQQ